MGPADPLKVTVSSFNFFSFLHSCVQGCGGPPGTLSRAWSVGRSGVCDSERVSTAPPGCISTSLVPGGIPASVRAPGQGPGGTSSPRPRRTTRCESRDRVPVDTTLPPHLLRPSQRTPGEGGCTARQRLARLPTLFRCLLNLLPSEPVASLPISLRTE